MKPISCNGCPLRSVGKGFAKPIGPKSAPLAIVGEALGSQEAAEGKPFVGPSGFFLNRILKRIGVDREEVRITNIISCQPPGDKLLGTAYERDAISHCSRHLNPVLAERKRVILAVGSTAGRELIHASKSWYKGEFFHGTVHEVGNNIIIPTFHPAYIMRGNFNLTGVMLWDAMKAHDIAMNGLKPKLPANLILDPSVEDWEKWVEKALASGSKMIAVDTETARKADDEGSLTPALYGNIFRINFSVSETEAITVPFSGQYLNGIKKLLMHSWIKVFWNKRYDLAVLSQAGIDVPYPIWDAMDAWHCLQSDLPRSLGFVAPFYSDYGPWKHLNSSSPALYAAIDALQTYRIMVGVERDLRNAGMWEVFERDVTLGDQLVLEPATATGILVDEVKLLAFRNKLASMEAEILGRMQDKVPESLKPLHPKTGWVKPPSIPIEVDGQIYNSYITKDVETVTKVCHSCNAIGVTAVHRCKDRGLTPDVQLESRIVPRYFVREPFNPASVQQVQAYLTAKGYSKDALESTDRRSMLKLADKDPFVRDLLDFREINKVQGTYVTASLERLKESPRLHPQFLHKPSTMRLSCIDPNIQNIPHDRNGIAAGFRETIVPAPGCVLIEADFSGIEAVLTGYFANDPNYMRLAILGIHDALVATLDGQTIPYHLSDPELAAFLKPYKKDPRRPACKRTVHLTNYGGTPNMMVMAEPGLFPSLRSAKKLQDAYLAMCPKLPQWWEALRDRARVQGYLGGMDHPFRYRHWFWNVFTYSSKTGKFSLGEDAKRLVAFYPQSTAAGILIRSAIELMTPSNPNYIGDLFYGKSPIRALIHDSILAEVPEDRAEECMRKMHNQMTQPWKELPVPASWDMGTHLAIGVEIKSGKHWGEMKVWEKK